MTKPALDGSPSAVNRFAWQSVGLMVGRGAGLVVLGLLARDLGTSRYGHFVVLLALLELAIAPGKATVWQGAAARFADGASHASWRRTLAGWWLIGAVILGPTVWLLDDATSACVFVAASGLGLLMVEHIPHLVLRGDQKRIAIGIVGSQLTRLALIVMFVAAGTMTPTVALALFGASYLVGIALLRSTPHDGAETTGMLLPEVGTEAILWIEVSAPILVVAALLGLEAAGGFDLLYKLSAALAELIAGIGLVALPDLVAARGDIGRVVRRALRIPTMLAVVAAVVFMVTAPRVLEALFGRDLDLDAAAVLLSVTLVLAPWMGIAKAGLITGRKAGWVFVSQLATAGSTLVASLFVGLGITWAAGAVAVGTIAGASVRWLGMRKSGLLSRARLAESP